MAYKPVDHTSENKKNAELNKKYGMPELKGSEKQVSWAESIRAGIISDLNSAADDFYNDRLFKTVREYHIKEDDPEKEDLVNSAINAIKKRYLDDYKSGSAWKTASYWIENRYLYPKQRFYNEINLEYQKILKSKGNTAKTSELTSIFIVGHVYKALENKNITFQVTQVLKRSYPYSGHEIEGKFLTNDNDHFITTDYTTSALTEIKSGVEYARVRTHLYGSQYTISANNKHIPGVVIGKGDAARSTTSKTKTASKAKSSATKTRTPKHGMTAKQIMEAIKGMSRTDKEAFIDKLNRTLPENKQEHTYKTGIRRGAYIADAKRVSKSFGWRLSRDGKKVYYEGRSSRADSDPERTWHGTAAAKTHLKKIVGETATKTKAKKTTKTTKKKSTKKKSTKKTAAKRKTTPKGK